MAYEKVYSRINWENEPSTKSPINEENLNKMDFALNEIDNRTVELSGYESIVIDYSNQAKTSATNALSSETKAKTSEQNAYSYEQSALSSKNQAEVFKNEAETHANNASDSEINAKASEDNASASELLAKISEENASGFAESAETSAQKAKASEDIAVTSASSAKTDSGLAKSYTVGTHGEVRENDDTDNAKYYYEQTKGISQSLSGALKPMGTIVFDNLPSSPNSGDMYNISNEFITDDRFKEGTGKTMPIGTNVYFTEDGYWDCLAGSPVTGIKGSNETSYRQGNVEITPDDLGLSIVATSGSYADLSNKPTIATLGGDDASHRVVTDEQISSWNNKAEISNIPTKISQLENDSGYKTTDTNTTYTLTQDSTDGHKITLTPSSGTAQTITIPDTKNTAGSTNTSSKIYLIGATSQETNPKTYSHDTVYVGTDGHLYSDNKQVVNLSGSQALTNKTYNGYTLGAACAYGVATSVTNGDTSNLPTNHAVAIALSTKLGLGNIANNLTTTSSGYALDARQGKALGDRVSNLEKWTNSGNWWYRKVGTVTVSGSSKVLYELCYKGTHTVAMTSSFGNLYYNSTSLQISYPLTFSGTLSQTATVMNGSGLYFVNINNVTSTKISLWIASAKASSNNVEVNIHCFAY